MKWAAYDQDGYVLFFSHESPPEGLSSLGVPDNEDWSTPPHRYMRVKVVDGALAWVDTRTLEQSKTQKNEEINAARLAANRSTFTFAGKAIACDELSRSDIDGVHGIILMTSALPPGWPGGWKAVDNTYVAITDVATWGAFYAAMVAQGMANFAKAQTLKAALAAATTTAEVEAIQW